MLAPVVDELIVLAAPSEYFAIAPWYEDFEELRDDAVSMLLERARQEQEGVHTDVGRA
jgi:predicted phosphoribosyltransferase